MENKNLFRLEVFGSKKDKQRGSIILIYPVSNYVLLAGALCLVLIFLLSALNIQYTRYSDNVGVLEPSDGVVKIYTPQIGLMRQALVTEGQFVKKGQVLFTFGAENSGAGGENVAQALDRNLANQIVELRNELEVTTKLNLARLASVKNNVAALVKEREILDAETHIRLNLVQSAQQTAARYDQLLSSGFAPDSLARQKKDELLGQQGNLQTLRKLIANNDAEQARLMLELTNTPLQANLAEVQIRKSIEKAEAELRSQKYRGEWSIVAPCDGVISSIAMTKNQTAYSGLLLATILPSDSSLYAQLYAPSRSLGFIKVGQKVVMKLDAFPYQKFGVLQGTVAAIADSPSAPSELFSGNRLQASNLTGEALYIIRVIPEQSFMNAYGNQHKLRAGMQFSARIELDSRTIFEWVLEPLYGMRNR